MLFLYNVYLSLQCTGIDAFGTLYNYVETFVQVGLYLKQAFLLDSKVCVVSRSCCIFQQWYLKCFACGVYCVS
jgi:hypothetical protein